MDLHHGSYKTAGFSTVDETAVVDTFYIERVISQNGFGCPPHSSRQTNLSDGSSELGKRAASKEFHSCGVWPLASYINHSCNSNARRAFIGDMMIVRATRDLAPDTEISFWYRFPVAEGNAVRQKQLEHWAFRCDCAMCRDDQATGSDVLSRSERQRAEALRYLRATPRPNLPKIEEILANMELGYAQPASLVPRLHSWELYLGLAQNYMLREQRSKAIDSALKSLASLGYVIQGGSLPRTRSTPMLVRQWGLLQDATVECWMLLASAYELVAPDRTEYAVRYAKLSYRICVGEDETFDGTYRNFG
ncbi:tpr domain protein [Phlyctema vagabunda]|uniref:Tpr domain protein n=1 Tax=Phlyctema vagabunda TaxID=108571 RepID=A0ABR4PBX8_9HELO